MLLNSGGSHTSRQTSFARPLDLSLHGQVKVADAGVLVNAGELPCGVFFSRGCFVGGGVTIAADAVQLDYVRADPAAAGAPTMALVVEGGGVNVGGLGALEVSNDEP